MRYFILCAFFALLPGLAWASTTKIYGLYEHVLAPEITDKSIKAKLDTGATTSSLGAEDIEIFEKGDQEWVRFKPQIEGSKIIERPLARHSKIKLRPTKAAAHRSTQRPVIMLDVCFDGKKYTIEVNLADRSRFKYPMLIGANSLMEFGASVDPSLQYRALEGCK